MSDFGISISDVFFISDFGFSISDLFYISDSYRGIHLPKSEIVNPKLFFKRFIQIHLS
jgi:hypothetical protein